SHSSYEMHIQQKWTNKTKPCVDELLKDDVGNAIGVLNQYAPFKVLLAGHCDEIGLMITRIDENGFLFMDKVGGINPKAAVGMRVRVLGEAKSFNGVIG